MKKIALLFLGSALSLSIQAATSITTASVSGHWTAAGSPYLIYNNIQVDDADFLRIDPGVSVIFQGPYSLRVFGMLKASGTVGMPIDFTINDTSGWADMSPVSPSGGWRGIQFNEFSGSGSDSSELRYCNFSYTKFDSVAGHILPTIQTLGINRSLSVTNCNFFKNNAQYNDLLYIYVPHYLEIKGCNFYDNHISKVGNVVFAMNVTGDSMNIESNKFHHNTGWNVFYGAVSAANMHGNEFYENNIADAPVVLYPSGSHYPNAVVHDNVFHHNITKNCASITCGNGYVEIYNNLICNNTQTISTGCGAVEGGSGLRLNGDGPDSTNFTVYNNVIANNHSEAGGGGIGLYHAKATIVNNAIINNSDVLSIVNDLEPIVIKNNIIVGNPAVSNINGSCNAPIAFDHNWVSGYTATEFRVVGYDSFSSWRIWPSTDTNTNIVGAAPGMVAPTHTVSYTDDATAANFKLLSGSLCIDAGDNSAVRSGALDKEGNYRIYGLNVDLGAYEYGSGAGPLFVQTQQAKPGLACYPNPAVSTIYVSVPAAKGNLMLMDVSGKMVMTYTVANSACALDVHMLPKGEYMLVWTNGVNGRATEKITLQ